MEYSFSLLHRGALRSHRDSLSIIMKHLCHYFLVLYETLKLLGDSLCNIFFIFVNPSK
jgi:hypothetical protein